MNIYARVKRIKFSASNLIRQISQDENSSSKMSAKVLIHGKRISYQIFGSKGPVVLLNSGGFGDFRLQFPNVVSKLMRDMTVVAWDPPGHGHSEKERRNYVPDDFCLFTDAKYGLELMKILGHSRYSVVGLSNGGITGAIMAAEEPAKIRKILLCNSFHTLHYPEVAPKTEEMFKGIRKSSIWTWYCKLYGEKEFENMMSNMLTALKKRADTQKITEILSEKLKQVNGESLYFRTQDDPFVDETHMQNYERDLSGMKIHIESVGGHNVTKCSDKFATTVKEFLLVNE